MKDINKQIKLIKTFWGSDLDIEIDIKNPYGVIIFEPLGEWDYDKYEWVPETNEDNEIIRRLVRPDKEYASNEFFSKLEELFSTDFTLDEAIDLVENFI